MNKIKIFFIFFYFIFIQTVIVFAGMTVEHNLMSQGEGAVIIETKFDVIVAVVAKAGGKDATNGNPPIIEVDVEKCLRGSLRPGIYVAVWKPFPHDIDWSGRDAEELIKAWESKLLSGPEEKSKWIFVGDFNKEENRFMISPLGRFEYSQAMEKWALENIAKS